MLFPGLRTILYGEKTLSQIVFRDFAEISSDTFCALCYKEHETINLRSGKLSNSETTYSKVSMKTKSMTDTDEN